MHGSFKRFADRICCGDHGSNSLGRGVVVVPRQDRDVGHLRPAPVRHHLLRGAARVPSASGRLSEQATGKYTCFFATLFNAGWDPWIPISKHSHYYKSVRQRKSEMSVYLDVLLRETEDATMSINQHARS